MLTVRDLAAQVGLELAAGEETADAPVRWVHITELPDPTPWLSGGELLLTTGIQLRDEASQREFVGRLAGHHLAGLGFGTGFDHSALPEPLVDEARRLGFPVFEVPYELPFIALTERAFTTLVNEQYDVLQRGIGIHKRLERLVLEERGLEEVVRALAAAIGGAVAVLGARGETIASKVFRRRLSDDAVAAVRDEVHRRNAEFASGAASAVEGTEFAPENPELAGRALVLGVAIRGRGAPQAWLVAARDGGGLGDFERLILNQAVTVVALELMRQRAMRDTERRLAGDVLAEAVGGRLSEHELSTRLAPFGVGAEAAVLVFAAGGDAPAPQLEGELDRFLSDAGVGALVATRERLLCAVVDCREGADPGGLAERARRALAAAGSGGGAAAQLPRSALRSRGCRAGQRGRAASGLVPRSRRLPAAAVAAGRRGAAAVLRQRARTTGRRSCRKRRHLPGHPFRLRRRAGALAGGVHRAERAVGARGASAVLPPPYAALPHPARRAAHRPGPGERARPHRVLAGPTGQGARVVKVAVLGAGGTIAPAIVRDLAESDEAEELMLLDLNGERAAAVAERHGAGKARGREADVRAGLAAALECASVVVNAASYRVNLDAMRACLEAGCHYLDLGGLYHVTGRQLELDQDFRSARLLGLLGMGSSPGKTNVMAVRAVRELGATPREMHVVAAG